MLAVTDAAEIISALFGDLVDPDAVAKMMPDASSVHVPGPLVMARVGPRKKPPGSTHVRKKALTPEQRRERTQARVGLASNYVGLAAGTAGLAAAAQDPRLANSGAGRAVLRGGRAVGRLAPKKITAVMQNHPGKVAAGALGLQAANLVGDAVANRVLGREAKRVDKSMTPNAKLVLGHLKRMTDQLKVHEEGLAPQQTGQKAAQAGAAARQGLNQTMSTTGGKVAAGTAVGATGVALAERSKRKNTEAYYGKSVEFEATGTFAKFDEDKRLAFGWANVSKVNGQPVLDRQGDYIAIEDMEDAAYVFVKKSRVGGDMHRRAGLTHNWGREVGKDGTDQPHKVADLVESMVFTPEKIAKMGLPPDFPQGWWVGFHYHDDEAWQEIKEGRRTGFSIHGKGVRKAVSLDELMAG